MRWRQDRGRVHLCERRQRQLRTPLEELTTRGRGRERLADGVRQHGDHVVERRARRDELIDGALELFESRTFYVIAEILNDLFQRSEGEHFEQALQRGQRGRGGERSHVSTLLELSKGHTDDRTDLRVGS